MEQYKANLYEELQKDETSEDLYTLLLVHLF